MRHAALSLALSSSLSMLALAGCAGMGPPPDAGAVPHAMLMSSHVDISDDRTDVFRVLRIEGHDAIDPTDLSVKSVEIDHRHLVAAGHDAHVDVDALAYFSNGARRLFWDPMHVQGRIDFVPQADATYVVRGSLSPEVGSVWIENAATHAVVGKKVSAPGRGASAAEAAAQGASAAAE